ncbi:MAG TPA: thioredoxin domain-containing protein [Polyangiaceae bacterium]|nr:thioredoxin domain-containing protein [Polyangiaceae bacterium]
MTTCRSPGEGGSEPSPAKRETVDVTLPQVDTSALTTREKSDWSGYVSEFLTPCADQPVSIAQCVQQSRPCKACVPAARFLVDLARRGQVRQQVEAVYKARFSPEAVRGLSLDEAPSKGPTDAKVVLAEFADFECPACGAARPQIEEVLKRHPRDVRLVFKHFPLTQHENAEKCARAAVAAGKQNKFWEMHAALFQSQPKLDSETVEGLAKGIGLDMKRFLQDRDSEATADFVARDRKQGEALALKSTPSIFMNGRPVLILGGDLQEELESWIQSELELGGAAPAGAAGAAPPAPPNSAASDTAPPPSAHPVSKPSPSGRPSPVGGKPSPSGASPSHS